MAASDSMTQSEGAQPDYAGFWVRFVATLIDTALLFGIVSAVLYVAHGGDYLSAWWIGESEVTYTAPEIITDIALVVAVMYLWVRWRGTPGKLALGLQVVDAATLDNINWWQALVRQIGYLVSFIPLLLGLLWIGFDAKKQGWHDKMAGTLVIYKR